VKFSCSALINLTKKDQIAPIFKKSKPN